MLEKSKLILRAISQYRPILPQWMLILAVAAFILLTGNQHFFNALLSDYPPVANNILFIISVSLLCFCLITFLLSWFCFPRTTHFILMTSLVITSGCAYFEDQLGVSPNSLVIESVLETNFSEASDLISLGLIFHIFLTGLLPALLVFRVRLKNTYFMHSLKTQASLVIASLIGITVLLLSASSAYASFFREHKHIRMHSNPIMFFYSVGVVMKEKYFTSEIQFFTKFRAEISESTLPPPLIIVVVGETVRAESFSLNGYVRPTTPRLKARKNVINFSQVSSCGTTTSISVPCMFSLLSRNNFTKSKAAAQSNLLDLLQTAGIKVLWRDNNSDSKGVALRVPYEDFKRPSKSHPCEGECRDVSMLDGLQTFIDQLQNQAGIIVLHQMGSHGPAYSKRYPPSFEKFKPTCKSADLSLCSTQEIINAYDNSIYYTDFFLDETIKLLAKNSPQRRTALIYISDHGESLGEYGLFLHGMPYKMAPEQQTHVAMVAWFSDNFGGDALQMKRNAARPYSHDNLSHTLLDLLDVHTMLFDEKLSMLSQYHDR